MAPTMALSRFAYLVLMKVEQTAVRCYVMGVSSEGQTKKALPILVHSDPLKLARRLGHCCLDRGWNWKEAEGSKFALS